MRRRRTNDGEPVVDVTVLAVGDTIQVAQPYASTATVMVVREVGVDPPAHVPYEQVRAFAGPAPEPTTPRPTCEQSGMHVFEVGGTTCVRCGKVRHGHWVVEVRAAGGVSSHWIWEGARTTACDYPRVVCKHVDHAGAFNVCPTCLGAAPAGSKAGRCTTYPCVQAGEKGWPIEPSAPRAVVTLQKPADEPTVDVPVEPREEREAPPEDAIHADRMEPMQPALAVRRNILRFLAQHPDQEFRTSEIADALRNAGVARTQAIAKTVAAVIGKMTGSVERHYDRETRCYWYAIART